MKTKAFFLLAGLGVGTCRAQTACDSLYQRASHPPLMMWFDKAHAIIAGRERLATTYHVPKERAGEAYFQVLIDEQGQAVCLQWIKVTNAAVQAAAADVVSALRFSPGMMQNKPLKVPMTLVVRFREGPSPTQTLKQRQHARHAQVP